jgi:hypothetical protein
VGRGIVLLFLDLGARRGGWSAPRPGSFTPGKNPVRIVQEAGWASEPVWTCAKNVAPTGIRSPDRPARSQSLYRLSYPAPRYYILSVKCADVWKVCSFLKLTITYVFQQLPTSLNNYLRLPIFTYVAQQLPTSSNICLRHPTITYIVKQLPALPKNYLRHSTVTEVAQQLPTSPRNYIDQQLRRVPTITYVTQQLPKLPGNNITSHTDDRIVVLSPI